MLRMSGPDTLELPAQPEPAPARRGRRRWIGWLVAAVVLVVVAVVGYVVAENMARDYARTTIRDELASALSLDPAHPMDIDLGGGSFVLQAVRGTIDQVTVDVDDVPLGDIEGSLSIAAAGIPLDQAAPVETLTARATIDPADVQKLRGYISDIDPDSITLGDGVVDVATTLDAGFLTIPVSAGITPSVADGGLRFAATSVTINGAELSVADLLDGPLGSVAGDLLPTQSFCIAQYLPASLVLTGVDVSPERLELAFTGDSVVLAALDETGACA
jgi:hypothetical protein